MTTAISLTLLSTTVWSNTFYLGAEGGPNLADFKQTSSVVSPGSFNVKNGAHFSGTGLLGSLFGGYALTIKQFYLAAEANISISSLDSNSFNSEFVHSSFSNTDYKMQHGFSISALPGYLFTKSTLFYVRLGYANTNFKVSTTDISLANINKNLDGFRYGVGIQQTINPNFSVRLEYNQISYQSTSFTKIDPVGMVTKSTKITPQTNQVMLGLAYNFA